METQAELTHKAIKRHFIFIYCSAPSFFGSSVGYIIWENVKTYNILCVNWRHTCLFTLVWRSVVRMKEGEEKKLNKPTSTNTYQPFIFSMFVPLVRISFWRSSSTSICTSISVNYRIYRTHNWIYCWFMYIFCFITCAMCFCLYSILVNHLHGRRAHRKLHR